MIDHAARHSDHRRRLSVAVVHESGNETVPCGIARSIDEVYNTGFFDHTNLS